eukprot:12673888-Heterocapsa_arctica.AAC.1
MRTIPNRAGRPCGLPRTSKQRCQATVVTLANVGEVVSPTPTGRTKGLLLRGYLRPAEESR